MSFFLSLSYLHVIIKDNDDQGFLKKTVCLFDQEAATYIFFLSHTAE